MLSDPLVQQQYAMTLTKAVDAWAQQTGSREIVIAILDEGVDTSHPDLNAAIGGTYDAIDNDTYQEPNPWDGHGTACAGLAAAVPNNAVGIRGSGGGCRIYAVRIARSDYKDGPWITSNQAIASAINWAWKNGASVISNSWGGGAPSNAIIQEFERARSSGRNGLGCVIVIAAGNDFKDVTFPGNLANVLTVSASNQYDEAKTPTSRDGETWWGTNHGPEIDVAAPGVFNLTTDIHAGAGYDAGDYEPRFNGTSSACPIVAGACGLVLSAAPTLREDEVRGIIAAAADKVGPYPYSNGRNDYFGNGRLNVLKAVQEAQRRSSAPKKNSEPQLDADVVLG
jgi:subtilisin family serine protease